MRYVVCNGFQKKKLKICLALLLVVMTMINDVKITKASNNRDYLNITLADIIVTWYNASGVAIGNSQLLNEIEALYGLITLEDLVDNEVIVTTDITASKEDIKEAIGYGSASVPYLRIDHRKLRTYLGGMPTDTVANQALTAMFSWENNATEESIFEALGIVVGNVVNLGKIGYNVIKDTLVENIHSLPLVQTLKDVYNNFTNSTYFQDILNRGNPVDTIFDYSPWEIRSTVEIPVGYQLMISIYNQTGNVTTPAYLMPYHVFAVIRSYSTAYPRWFGYNNTTVDAQIYPVRTTLDKTNKIITITELKTPITLASKQLTEINPYIGERIRYWDNYGPFVLDTSNTGNAEFYEENDPWGTESGGSGTGTGITEYINKAVGNITKQNYLDLTANIGNGEYMFIFNKYQYDVIINQITDNTNNGDYSVNGDIITTYNTTYIQYPTSIETRPTYAPAPTGQPIQPFISPRPTPIPEETEEAIYNGGIAESIKDKFPFCIPWDIQALITGLWSNNRQAPYIHWEARFGSWGKLGEVTIDLQPYDTAAQIFRSTTLLLWIIGLVVLTRNMIGS